MPTIPEGKRRIGRNVSLPPEQDAALVQIAQEEGHGIPSQTVQMWIEREARQRWGKDWRLTIVPPARTDEREAVPA